MRSPKKQPKPRTKSSFKKHAAAQSFDFNFVAALMSNKKHVGSNVDRLSRNNNQTGQATTPSRISNGSRLRS